MEGLCPTLRAPSADPATGALTSRSATVQDLTAAEKASHLGDLKAAILELADRIDARAQAPAVSPERSTQTVAPGASLAWSRYAAVAGCSFSGAHALSLAVTTAYPRRGRLGVHNLLRMPSHTRGSASRFAAQTAYSAPPLIAAADVHAERACRPGRTGHTPGAQVPSLRMTPCLHGATMQAACRYSSLMLCVLSLSAVFTLGASSRCLWCRHGGPRIRQRMCCGRVQTCQAAQQEAKGSFRATGLESQWQQQDEAGQRQGGGRGGPEGGASPLFKGAGRGYGRRSGKHAGTCRDGLLCDRCSGRFGRVQGRPGACY